MTDPRDLSAAAAGIDIGGSGIKGGVVDLLTGELVGERVRESTPTPSEPQLVAEIVAAICARLPVAGPIGVTFPGVVRAGTIETAANMDPSWIGVDAGTLFGDRLRRSAVVLNDADAAGIAEMRFGAGRNRGGVVVMVTLGTGIGSALFLDGGLVPNTELGHIIVAGTDGEKLAAASVRTSRDLSWKAWTGRLNAYLDRLESLISPDLIIIGGGISQDHARFLPRLRVRAKVIPAKLFNDAGIVGAALASAAPAGSSADPEAPPPA